MLEEKETKMNWVTEKMYEVRRLVSITRFRFCDGYWLMECKDDGVLLCL